MAETKSQPHDSIILDKNPKIISILVTSRCNLRCVMCDHGIREVEKQDFDSSLIGNMGDSISRASLVDLTGLGEPLLSKLFWEILANHPVTEKTSERDFVIYFNTNGTLLNENNIRKILNSRVRKIKISLDAADADVYYKIRGVKLADVVAGVRNLILKRNSLHRDYPRIGIQMTLMRENLHQLRPMIDLCEEVKADFFEVWSLNNVDESLAKIYIVDRNGWVFNYHEQMLDGIPKDELTQVIADFHAYARQKQIPFFSVVLGKRTASEDSLSDDCWDDTEVKWREESIRCIIPWKEQRIDYYGNVFACCWGPRPIGNIRDATLKSIWHGEAIHEMRRDLIDGKVPRLCVGAACPYLIGRSGAAAAPPREPSSATSRPILWKILDRFLRFVRRP